ncbi:Alpha-amylase isozyme 3D, partial [Trifolium medium]|nr:Alpha-amylase isozyme 3D [Trifolium medium]
AILHDKEVAITELEAAKSLFHKNLEESVEEKFSLQSKLVLAKQDAVDLAVQVEKLAEVAFQQATSHILQDAQLRISSAETTAAEAAHQIEKQIKDATEGTISSIVEKSKYAIERALAVAEEAGMLSDIESQLMIARNEVARLNIELEHTRQQLKAFEQRAIDAEKDLLDLQESRRKTTLQQEEEMKSL